MKKIVFILSILALSSCKKCYECETPLHAETYCKGDDRYDDIKKGVQFTDEAGELYHCK